MLDEKLLREHINSYAIHIDRDTFEEFRKKLCASEKGKLSSRKKKIYITVHDAHYPISGIRVSIKAKINQVPCNLCASFNYNWLKSGFVFSFKYNHIGFRPHFFPFAVRGEEPEITYLSYVPFMVWMTDSDDFIEPGCLIDYEAIKSKDTERIETAKYLYGEEYITNIKKYCGANANRRFKTVFEARVAATILFDRLHEFMEEIACDNQGAVL